MTSGSEETVPWETPALVPTLPEGAPATPAEVDVLADARAEALSWSPNTRRAYVAGWWDFTRSVHRHLVEEEAGPGDVPAQPSSQMPRHRGCH